MEGGVHAGDDGVGVVMKLSQILEEAGETKEVEDIIELAGELLEEVDNALVDRGIDVRPDVFHKLKQALLDYERMGNQ